ARVPRASAKWADAQAFFKYEGAMTWPLQEKLFSERVVRELDPDVLWPIRKFFREDLPAVTAAQYLDMCLYLPHHILFKVDRATMAHGVEARVPFLDHRLVEAVFNLPLEALYRHGERKALLKRVAGKYVPSQILTSRKKGFSSPLPTWTDGAF